MFKKGLFSYYSLSVIIIIISILLSHFLLAGYALIFQLIVPPVVMGIFTYIVWSSVKKSLLFLLHTMKKIGKADPTISENDMTDINKMTRIHHFDIRKLITFTNTLLLNQKTLLDTATRDRNFIDKSRRLRDAIIEINQRIVAGENIDTLMQKLLDTAVNVINDCDAGVILQRMENSDSLKTIASTGYDLEKLESAVFPLKETYIYQLGKMKDHTPVIIRNRRNYDLEHDSAENFKRYEKAGFHKYSTVITAPVLIDGNLYGIISLASKNKKGFGSDDVQLMKYFTSEIGVVIKNSMLIRRALYLSKYDSLTGIHNRYFFEDVVELVLEDARRYGRGIHIVLFDLDDFKEVNDTYGHEAGDKVLKIFAGTVSSSIRGSDIFARYGGDEFVALFHNTTKEDIGIRIGKIVENIAKTPVHFSGEEYYIKYSYGIAEFPKDGRTIDELLRKADQNMYKEKAKRKLSS